MSIVAANPFMTEALQAPQKAKKARKLSPYCAGGAMRNADGKCPPRRCKYGARTAEGKCPRKSPTGTRRTKMSPTSKAAARAVSRKAYADKLKDERAKCRALDPRQVYNPTTKKCRPYAQTKKTPAKRTYTKRAEMSPTSLAAMRAKARAAAARRRAAKSPELVNSRSRR